MKRFWLLIATCLFASPALADGFTCANADDSLRVKVYNQTWPDLGTRTGAVMVISDPTVAYGRKTIGVFRKASMTLSNRGASYHAKVDLRSTESGRRGENIAGTKLGYLKSIYLDVDFSYANPIEAGEAVVGKLSLLRRYGGRKSVNLTCERYLKTR